jgi:hypothetical protein
LLEIASGCSEVSGLHPSRRIAFAMLLRMRAGDLQGEELVGDDT